MLTAELKKLNFSERVLLAEELWDSVTTRAIAAKKEEVNYVKQRLQAMKDRDTKWTEWSKIK